MTTWGEMLEMRSSAMKSCELNRRQFSVYQKNRLGNLG